MKRYCSILFMLLVVSTGNAQSKLDSAFIRSLQKEDFNQLKSFLPTRVLYKSLEKGKPQKTDKEIDAFLLKNNSRLKENWLKILTNSKSNKLNLSSIIQRETLIHPIQPGSPVNGLVLVYEYNGKLYDDFSLIVTAHNGQLWLLEIPNATSFLVLKDNGLRNSTEARNARLLNDPVFREKMAVQVKSLIRQAKGDSLLVFAQSVLFHKEDDTASWKRAISPGQAAELELARNLMEKVAHLAGTCTEWKPQELMLEKESEGTWVIQPVKCGEKQIMFAFIVVEDKLLLGDIDVD